VTGGRTSSVDPGGACVDLNADLGEGFGAWRLGDDDALLHVVTSANVACGFHAGDPMTMRRVCQWAVERGVAVGAQVGYRDLAGFGRRRIEYDLADLRDEIIYQIAALDGFCRLQDDRVRYVKPHGALYHTATTDVWQASAVVAAIVDYDRSLPVLCLPGSVLATVAAGAGVRCVAEGFADRAYRPDGTLVPRGEPGAIVSNVDTVVARAVHLAELHRVEAIDGSMVAAPVESLCLHGDTPGAVELARRVRAGLQDAGITVTAFVPPVRESPAAPASLPATHHGSAPSGVDGQSN
jgi:5-oxoprolinase (ATP-hydrolysing) subunit A